MAMSTWKSEKACMDCRKLGYSQTNYSKNIWLNMDTLNNPTHQAYGNMSVTLSGSTYVWMISE